MKPYGNTFEWNRTSGQEKEIVIKTVIQVVKYFCKQIN